MMPTPEEQRQYTRLSTELQRIGHAVSGDLPAGTASLRLHSIDGNPYLDAYNRAGKIVATLRTDQMPEALREPIERLAQQNCPDPDGIICPL